MNCDGKNLDLASSAWGNSCWNFEGAAAAKSLQWCQTLQPHRQQPTRLLRPWDSPGKNTGVGCHFLLQCMKVKSESEVAQLYPTLRDTLDYSPPGSSVHGIFQARVREWAATAVSYFEGWSGVISDSEWTLTLLVINWRQDDTRGLKVCSKNSSGELYIGPQWGVE